MSATLEEVLQCPEQFLDGIQRKWLTPRGRGAVLLHRVLYTATTCCIRLAFRFRVHGQGRLLPAASPVIFAPNHESSLDASLVAVALPYAMLRQTFWAVRKGRVLSNPIARGLSRIARTIPIDRDVTALAAGATVLQQDCNLVWFPEGTRSRDGELQDFKFGVGALARHFRVPVIPVGIKGSFEALPPDSRAPRLFSNIVVRFGQPLLPDETAGDDAEAFDQIADQVRERLQGLTETG